MTQAASERDLWQEPNIRNYWLLSLGALLAITVALAFRRVGAWSLLPILIGSLSLAGRWRSGPLAALLALGWVLFSERLGLSPLELLEGFTFGVLFLIFGGGGRLGVAPSVFGARGLPLSSDVLLVTGVLLYCATHYRLVSLVSQLWPVDRRPQPLRPAQRPEADPSPLRSERSMSPHELMLLVATVPGWIVLAALVWLWVSQSQPPVLEWPSTFWQGIYPELAARGDRVVIELAPVFWRALLLLWVLGMGVLVIGALIGYLSHRRLSAAEAALYVQDQAWLVTCREQRRLNHWLVWARRRNRGKEPP